MTNERGETRLVLVFGAIVCVVGLVMLTLMAWAKNRPPPPPERWFRVAGKIETVRPRISRSGLTDVEFRVRLSDGSSWTGLVRTDDGVCHPKAINEAEIDRLIGRIVQLGAHNRVVLEWRLNDEMRAPAICRKRR